MKPTTWIPIERIEYYIQLEPFLIFWIILFIGFIFYKLFLKKISEKRHLNLKARFSQTFLFLSIASISSSFFWLTADSLSEGVLGFTNIKMSNYLGLFSLLLMSYTIIRLSQIIVYLYLFFMNMSQGVPRLIANLFTFIFTFVIITFIASEVFSIHLTTMIATSAVFSLVLGLALQDTLGNLFSGVTMQIGSPFSIGDWVEIHNGNESWSGQIQEITWRATFIMSFADELIMIPNKTITQSQILIFTNNLKPLRLNHIFKLNHDVDPEKVNGIIIKAIKDLPEVLSDPAPRVLLLDIHESWLTFKVFYSLPDYSLRYRVGDVVLKTILATFKENNIKLAQAKLHISKNE